MHRKHAGGCDGEEEKKKKRKEKKRDAHLSPDLHVVLDQLDDGWVATADPAGAVATMVVPCKLDGERVGGESRQYKVGFVHVGVHLRASCTGPTLTSDCKHQSGSGAWVRSG